MNFSERKEIIQFFNKIEADYETESWIYRGVKVWPILKTSLFLKMFWEAQNRIGSKSPRFALLAGAKGIARKIKAFYEFSKIKWTPVDFLFFSAVNFREKFEGESFHKFYDPIGDYLEFKNKSFFFLEHGLGMKGKKYKNRGLNIGYLYYYFEDKVRLNQIDFKHWKGFEKLQSFIGEKLDLSNSAVESEILDILKVTLIWEALFSWILEKMGPKKIFLLSYYNLPCFGLLIAAKKKGIECIDIQHGAQGSSHVAYSGFNQDYLLIPDFFWFWDHQSESQLKGNLGYSGFKTIVGGNPWHYFLDHREPVLKKNGKTILYTLQPIQPLVSDYVLEVMQETKDEYDWLIRTHPRIAIGEKNVLIQKLESLGIYKEKMWKLANETPLPLLLKNVDLHISLYSGCIQEAADLGTFSIILEKNGEITFSHLIEQGIAQGGIDYDQENLRNAIKSNIGKIGTVDLVNMEAVLDEIC